MAKKQSKSYVVYVKGQSESDWRGAQPESIDPLLESQNTKNTAGLEFDIIKTQVELLLNAGKTKQALEALEVYKERVKGRYQAPLNTFPRDMQNGQHPYIGAHCFVGALRDTAAYLFPNEFYKKKGDKAPSKKHFRKAIQVRPHHIFLVRDGETIKEPDSVDGQQPVGEVRGFARYEVIRHPFTFDFKILVSAAGVFSSLLSNQEKLIEALYQSTFHGIGAGRGVGYGAWKIVEHKIEDTPAA
jgi:hypothetical protein